MTLKNVRERTANIGKLGRLLAAQPKDEDQRVVEQAMRVLVAQLKVNFRPLYPETVSALAALADERGEVLWDIVWDQLQRTISAADVHAVDLDWTEPTWAHEEVDQSPDDDAIDEEDAEFRCLSLNKGRRVLETAWASSETRDLSSTAEIEVSVFRSV